MRCSGCMKHGLHVRPGPVDLGMDEHLAVQAPRANERPALEVHGQDVLARDLVQADGIGLHQEQVVPAWQAHGYVAQRHVPLALMRQDAAGQDQPVRSVICRHRPALSVSGTIRPGTCRSLSRASAAPASCRGMVSAGMPRTRPPS